MNTMQFLMTILNWLQADPSHAMVAASAIAAVTKTPDPNTTWGKVYKVIEVIALNVLHAKETGVVQPADVEKVAQQVAAILAKQATPVVNPVIPHQ